MLPSGRVRRRAGSSGARAPTRVARNALPSMAALADERRRYQRQAAARPIRLWLRAADISLHGLKGMVQSLLAGIVQAPQVCLEASDEFS